VNPFLFQALGINHLYGLLRCGRERDRTIAGWLACRPLKAVLQNFSARPLVLRRQQKMRSIILASALLVVALAVLLAISASHKKDTSTEMQAASSQSQAPTQPTPADGVRRVTVEELRAALEKGTAVVIDVRSEEQYKAGHIKGALWIQGNQITERTKELPKDKLIVTYCS
jgi:hypothetical protein